MGLLGDYKEALENGTLPPSIKSYEEQVYHELLAIGKAMTFANDEYLDPSDILELLSASVILPKIGSRTQLRD